MADRITLDASPSIDQIIRMFRQLDQVPTTMVTKAAKAGGQVLLAKAKELAPEDTGELKASMFTGLEKGSTPAKRFYFVTFRESFNHILVKMYGPKDEKGEPTKRAYYPASQEWGWPGKSVSNPQVPYHPGLHYLRRAADENSTLINDTMLETLGQAIDRVLRGG